MAETKKPDETKAAEAQRDALPGNQKPVKDEQRAADQSPDQHATASATATHPSDAKPDTVATAKVAGPLDAKMSAAEHMAQKFGNDPANPKPSPAAAGDYDGPTTRLSRITPDKPEGVFVDVHPDMVGDYLRAGWNVAV